MSKGEPETITLEEYRRLVRKQKRVKTPRPKRDRSPPVKCVACGKNIGSQSVIYLVRGREAIPYHFRCHFSED